MVALAADRPICTSSTSSRHHPLITRRIYDCTDSLTHPTEDDVLGNLYAFGGNNPGTFVDPMGLEGEKDLLEVPLKEGFPMLHGLGDMLDPLNNPNDGFDPFDWNYDGSTYYKGDYDEDSGWQEFQRIQSYSLKTDKDVNHHSQPDYFRRMNKVIGQVGGVAVAQRSVTFKYMKKDKCGDCWVKTSSYIWEDHFETNFNVRLQMVQRKGRVSEAIEGVNWGLNIVLGLRGVGKSFIKTRGIDFGKKFFKSLDDLAKKAAGTESATKLGWYTVYSGIQLEEIAKARGNILKSHLVSRQSTGWRKVPADQCDGSGVRVESPGMWRNEETLGTSRVYRK